MDICSQITFATYTCTNLCYKLMNTENAFVVYIYVDTTLVEKVMKSLQSSGLVCPAGIATSLTNSGEQWLVNWFIVGGSMKGMLHYIFL